MFNFDELNSIAAGGGLPGPFINWQVRTGTHAPAETWALLAKGDDQSKQYTDITPNMASGVVFDYNTIKIGWEKWAPMGQPNEIQWAPTMNLELFPRPSADKRQNEMGREVFIWQKIFAIRIAITPDLAGTWSTSQFSSTIAFDDWVLALKAEGRQHPGKLPLVQFTGVRDDFGGSRVPILTITDWKDAPDCLRQDTGVSAINTGPQLTAPAAPAAPAPAPAAPAAPAPAPAGTIPTGARF